MSLTIDQLRVIHAAIVEGGLVPGANLLLHGLGEDVRIDREDQALTILRRFCQGLLDNENYEAAAALMWGEDMFDMRPEFPRSIFKFLPQFSKMLLCGSCSSSKTYTAVAFFLLDFLRDPTYTSVKLIAVNESHLKTNMFAHMLGLLKACAVPMIDADDLIVREADNYFGLRSAGNDMGVDGVAFRQSRFGSGTIRGYKPKPYRPSEHPKWGHMTRLRILGDECLPFDQTVRMADGSMRMIGELVASRCTDPVLSVNNATGMVESKPITGWHSVPLRGRRIVTINGARMTEDHPILTPVGYVEALHAANADLRCMEIHATLQSKHQIESGTAVVGRWRNSWRRINQSEGERPQQRKAQIRPRGLPVGISQVEEGGFGGLLHGSNSRPTNDGVGWGDLQFLHNLSSRVYEDLVADGIQAGVQENEMDNPGVRGINGPARLGCVVHGRREFQYANDGTASAPIGKHFIPLVLTRGGPDCEMADFGTWRDPEHNGDTEGSSPYIQHEADGETFRDNLSVHSRELEIQNRQDADARCAGAPADNGWADCGEVRCLQEGFRRHEEQKDVLKRVLKDAPETTRFAREQEDETVYCIDVADNHNFFAGNVCVKNCQHWPAGQFSDLNSPLASASDNDLVKVALAFNPVDASLPVVQMAEPEHGWIDPDLDALYQWKSKHDWNVLRLDAKRCENVIERRLVYPGFQTFEAYMGYMKGGDNSASYYVEARGFPPIKGAVNTVIPGSWVNGCWGEATFVGGVEFLVTVDLAYAGQDNPVMGVFRWGEASGWRKRDGSYVIFKNRLNPGRDKPRLVLQLDQLMTLTKAADTITIAEEIMSRCKELGVKPDRVAVDSTGMGAGTYSHLARYFGDVLGIRWGEKATGLKILSEDKEGSDKICDNNVTEMWWTLRRWMDPTVGAVIINPNVQQNPLTTELTYRRYWNLTRGRIRVESKEEYKARQKLSPDCFVAGTMVATPIGEVPIETLRAGDVVLTPFGQSRIYVTHAIRASKLTSIELSNGSHLTGKGAHRVMTPSGWKRMDALVLTDTIESIKNRPIWHILKSLNSMVRNLGFKQLVDTIRVTTTQACSESAYFTGRFGSLIAARFLIRCACITSTVIGRITPSRILNSCFTRSTQNIIKTKNSKTQSSERSISGISTRRSWRLGRGIQLQKDLSGTEQMGSLAWQGESDSRRRAYNVGRNTKPHSRSAATSALGTASRKPDTAFTQRSASALASFVELIFSRTDTAQRKPAVRSARRFSCERPETVFNLTLEEDNAYYANGLLVENCADALVMSPMLVRQRLGEYPGIVDSMNRDSPYKDQLVSHDSAEENNPSLERGEGVYASRLEG